MTVQPDPQPDQSPIPDSSEAPRSSAGFYFEGVESPNGTIFPDILIDRVMPHLSGAEFKVLAYIVRRTFGFKKESDTISLDQICNGITRRDGSVLDEGTGLARKTAVAAIHGLESKGVIICQRRSSPERGNLPTSFALRFKGQLATSSLDTNLHQSGVKTYPDGEAPGDSPSNTATPGLGTEHHSQQTARQSTVRQRTVKQEFSPTPQQQRDHRANSTLPADLERIWNTALDYMNRHLARRSFEAWVLPARLVSLTAGEATVSLPTVFAKRWVERELGALFSEAFNAVTDTSVAVHFVSAQHPERTQEGVPKRTEEAPPSRERKRRYG